MFIRTINRKNKDGSQVTYVQLVHNERDKAKGYSKAKILYNFGRLENLDIEQLKRLVKSISRFLPAEDALEVQAQFQHRGRHFKWLFSRSFGGIYLLENLWQQLGFRQVLERRIQERQFKTPVAQAIFAMVANRCLAPSSKLAVTEWVAKEVFIPALAKIDVQVLYRAMDLLLAHQADFEQELYWATADLLHLEVDLLFFDTTSTYFETETETELKKRGHSKDKRPDLPQVVIGLAVTRDGIPVKHWVFAGNTQDMSTIETVKKDLCNWRLNRCIFVHDTGMTSDSNLQYLQRGGGHYIVGRKLKSGEAEAEQALSHRGRYQKIKEHLLAKEVFVGQGERRKRLVLVQNLKEQERTQALRQELIKTLEEKIQEVNSSRKKAHSKRAQQLKAHRIYGKYIKELKNGKLRIDHSKLQRERRYDGKYLLQSSDDTLTLEDIVLGYKQLAEVEKAFRTLKTTLEIRPNYHSKDERIRCHVFLCFIALVLVRIVENKTGSSWPKVRNEMNRLHHGEFKIDGKIVQQLTEPTQEQKKILNSLNIKEPPTVVGIHDA